MKRVCCFFVVLLLALCAAAPAFAATEAMVEQEEPAEAAGLWILTPKTPRAVKYLAYRETRKYYGVTAVDLDDPSWHIYIEDGDLNGPLVPELPFYEVTCDVIGQPFTYYDQNLVPGNTFYYPVIYDGFSAMRIDSVRILDEERGAFGESGDEVFLKWENGYYTPFAWVNTLPLNPAITKENPLVLYQTESGFGGVTLDGSFVYAIRVNKGRLAEEVIHEARQIHAKREKRVLAGEEVIRANRLITAKELKNPYITYTAVSKTQNARLNGQLKAAGYVLGDFDFSELIFPKKAERSFRAEKEIPLDDGACTVTVTVVGEETAVEAVVKKDNYAGKKTVEPGETREDVIKWAQNELDLYAFKRSMLEQAEVSIGGGKLIDVTSQPQEYMEYILGRHYEQWKDKDDVYLIVKELAPAGEPFYYSVCAVAQYVQGAAQAEISVYAGYASRQESVIQAKKNEPLTLLLQRMREEFLAALRKD